jgi:hypothetical protein
LKPLILKIIKEGVERSLKQDVVSREVGYLDRGVRNGPDLRALTGEERSRFEF